MFTRFCQCGGKFSTSSYCRTVCSAGFSKTNKIKRRQNSRRVTFIIKNLLPLTDHTQTTVIDDNSNKRSAFTHRCIDFHTGHFKSSVAADLYNLRLRQGNFSSQGCRQTKSHRSAAAAGQMMPRRVYFQMQGCPHLILPDVSNKYRIFTFKAARQFFHQPGRCQSFAGLCRTVFCRIPGFDRMPPMFYIKFFHPFTQLVEVLFHISD